MMEVRQSKAMWLKRKSQAGESFSVSTKSVRTLISCKSITSTWIQRNHEFPIFNNKIANKLSKCKMAANGILIHTIKLNISKPSKLWVHIIDNIHAFQSPCFRYKFRVAAVNTFGVGEFSRECQSETGIPFTKPAMRSAPNVTHVLDNSIRLEWPECTESGGSPLYGYDVYARVISKAGAAKDGGWKKLNSGTDDIVFADHYWVGFIECQNLYYEFIKDIKTIKNEKVKK
jgi:hypothetical protein